MQCSSDNFSSILFFCEQNNSQTFPPGLNLSEIKHRIGTERGLQGYAGWVWKDAIQQHLDRVGVSVKTLDTGNI